MLRVVVVWYGVKMEEEMNRENGTEYIILNHDSPILPFTCHIIKTLINMVYKFYIMIQISIGNNENFRLITAPLITAP